ncbi:hypothetical protein vBBceSLY5_0045 [Bacillus phage vB_BceS_LY5]|uniref:hypothetical protein n=1 Tax=Bacillus phage vB_BceS_LY5 TaxID=2996058 RepID=UPI00405517FE|nr:hypothetical protein vBBceSLY5_0045 [Bacillus phage vB_BceS_LY5]
MKKYQVMVALTSGHMFAHNVFLKTGSKSEQLEFVENNIDNTSTFYTGKEHHLIALSSIESIIFTYVY